MTRHWRLEYQMTISRFSSIIFKVSTTLTRILGLQVCVKLIDCQVHIIKFSIFINNVTSVQISYLECPKKNVLFGSVCQISENIVLSGHFTRTAHLSTFRSLHGSGYYNR